MLALQQMVIDIRNEAVDYGSLGNVPQDMQANVSNQMYLTSETLRLLPKFGPKMSENDLKIIADYKGFLDKSTKYIPSWVKVAVALALGLGTMVGWKRIVITVGEKIGKTHLTYAQGASAELVAALTIYGFDRIGLPVSTTHVLSSGVAGTMAANGSGLQKSTLRQHRDGLGLYPSRRRAALRLSLLALQSHREINILASMRRALIHPRPGASLPP